MLTLPEVPKSARPLIVQSDRSLLLEVGGEFYGPCRDAIAPFCELVKSPEHIHTYQITPLSIWNAAAAGHEAQLMLAVLGAYSRFDVPGNVCRDIADLHGRYGRLQLVADDDGALTLRSKDDTLIDQVETSGLTKDMVGERTQFTCGKAGDVWHAVSVERQYRGEIKRCLIKLGWPVADIAGYVEGGPLTVALADTLPGNIPFRLRAYQHEAVSVFHQNGSSLGGSGVVVLPCGAGKTVVGIGVMAQVGRKTLILTTNHTAVNQWRRELLEKTQLTEDQIGEYTGKTKDVRPVTISTYQILTYRRRKTDEFVHFGLFQQNDWGLVIYDEVHLLPAPVFRFTADIQSTRRLGLTATLVREDGKEDDVFTLIGPKRYDVPWKILERKGWIAKAICTEVRVPMESELRKRYALTDRRGQFRLAAENPAKMDVLRALLRRFAGDRVMIIGQYISQLERVARELQRPLITGKTKKDDRIRLYEDFSTGRDPVLIVSKVGNFAVDLPEARVIIQISGTFGSRQEEAQRLGRVLRPKLDGGEAYFFTLVSDESIEQEFGQHRQLFLTEQGYAYEIESASELLTCASGDSSMGSSNTDAENATPRLEESA